MARGWPSSHPNYMTVAQKRKLLLQSWHRAPGPKGPGMTLNPIIACCCSRCALGVTMPNSRLRKVRQDKPSLLDKPTRQAYSLPFPPHKIHKLGDCLNARRVQGQLKKRRSYAWWGRGDHLSRYDSCPGNLRTLQQSWNSKEPRRKQTIVSAQIPRSVSWLKRGSRLRWAYTQVVVISSDCGEAPQFLPISQFKELNPEYSGIMGHTPREMHIILQR